MDLKTMNSSGIKGSTQSYTKYIGIVIPVIGILASILIAALIIWPKVNEILELRKSNEELSGRVQVLEDKAAVLRSLDRNILEEQLASADLLLPSESSIFSVLRQIEATANSRGVLLTRIDANPGGTTEGGGIRAPVTAEPGGTAVVEITLTMISEYQSLLNFIDGLYNFSRVVSIDDITIGGGREGQGALTTSFAVKAHWKQLPQALGSIESPVQKLTAEEEQSLSDVQSPVVIITGPVPNVPIGRINPFEPIN